MSDRFEGLRRALEDAVLRGPGKTAPSLRQSAAAAGEVPEELRAVLEKTRQHAYKVTDEDIAALRAKFSDDELFEIIAATIVGEARQRFDKVEALLGASSRRDPVA